MQGAPPFTAEQIGAVEDRRGSSLLAANAGSGKTSVMVERFVEAAVLDGIPVGAILALTFTEKAAGELKERIRRRLTELGETERAREAEGAWVGTIHGFCARVLRAHPFPAQLDPRFTVLDEPAARRLSWTAYERAVEAWAGGTHAESDARLNLLATYGPPLRELILGAFAELRSRGHGQPRLAVPPPITPDGAPLARARAVAAAYLEGAGEAKTVAKARDAVAATEALLARTGDRVPWPSDLDPGKLGGKAKALEHPSCEAYTGAWAAYRQACADHHARHDVELMDGLLAAYGDAYAEAKRARAAVDFEDLQLAVRDLFAGDGALRERWSQRFELIMIDEFQDTNRLQLGLLERLERDNLFAVGDEFQSIYGFRHADVTIFRERRETLGAERVRHLRANFRSREALLDVLNGAFAPELGTGFEPLVAGRSPAPGPAEEGRLFDPDAPAATGGPAVELLVTATGGWEDHEADLGLALPGTQIWRRAEARLIAQRLRDEIDAGRRAGDIVVLVRAAASLRLLEQALEEHGVATYVVGGRGYWSNEQVRDGLAYLAVLANPLDESALYSVLASPFVGASADALILVADAGREHGDGAWAALRDAFVATTAGSAADRERSPDRLEALPEADRERLARFVAFLAAERRTAERTPVEVVLERAVAETGYDLAVLARPGGERRLANLRKLMRLAREFERAEGRDLRGFLDYAATQDLTQAREGEAALESEGLDAVRLMTIHRAKGLEFPVVCVADLGRQPPGGRPRLLVGEERVGLRVKPLGGGEGIQALAHEALCDERDAAEAEEERRLFYVAMTRAEELLILSGGIDLEKLPEGRPGRPPLTWILPALVDDLPAVDAVRSRVWKGRDAHVRVARNAPETVGTVLRAPAPPATTTPAAGPGTSLPPTPALANVPPPAAQGVLPAVAQRLSYSSLGEYAKCPYRFYLRRVLRLAEIAPPPLHPGAPGLTVAAFPMAMDPRVRGSAVHLLLEHLDFKSPLVPGDEAIRAAAAPFGGAPSAGEIADLRALVEAFIASPVAVRLAGAAAVRREAPFAFALEPGPGAPLLHGIVDVHAREADGTVLVVDYKSDRLDGADPVALVDRDYATQRAVYALAALREGAERVEVVYCFLEQADRPIAASFGPADAAALTESLVRGARPLLAGEYPVTPTPHRELCGTCPGRPALCSYPPEVTEAEAPPTGPRFRP